MIYMFTNSILKRESHQNRIKTRELLWSKQKHRCAYCKKDILLKDASLDHIIPIVILDEKSYEENLIVTCKRCNRDKGNKIIFTNLYDGVIYPIVDIPYFFNSVYIQKNKSKKGK